jgi:hypothetical protein
MLDQRPSRGSELVTSRTKDLSGEELRAALGYLKWTRERLAKESGVSPATVYRMLAQDGPIQARGRSIEQVMTTINAAGSFQRFGEAQPDLAVHVELEHELLRRLPPAFSALGKLWQISGETRDQDKIMAALDGAHDRVSCIYEDSQGDLRFDYIGSGIIWSRLNHVDQNLLDVIEIDVARTIAQRIYKSIITGDPVFAYCRMRSLDFTVLTVPCQIGNRPGVISVSQRGRPDLSK